MITEIFNNVFHSFWTWAGTVILVSAITLGLTRFGSALLAAFIAHRK